MPIFTEFVRAYPSFEEDGISGIVVFPMRPFRVLTSELDQLMDASLNVVKKKYSDHDRDAEMVSQLLNLNFNTELAQLERQGKVIASTMPTNLVTNRFFPAYDNRNMVKTCDGYTVFNPAVQPPCPTAGVQ